MPAQVLVVDQNPLVQTTIENSLNSKNCEVTSVRDALSGLDLAYKIKPDLMIADLRMEGLMVYSFCARVKQKSFLSHIPIFLLVQQNDVFDEARLRQSGVAGFIQKPVDPQKLKEMVGSYLTQSVSASIPESPVYSGANTSFSSLSGNGSIGETAVLGKESDGGQEFSMEKTQYDRTMTDSKLAQSYLKPDESIKIDDLMDWAQPEVSPFSEVMSPASSEDASEATQFADATQVLDDNLKESLYSAEDLSEVTQFADVTAFASEPKENVPHSGSVQPEKEKKEILASETPFGAASDSESNVLHLISSVNGKPTPAGSVRSAEPISLSLNDKAELSKVAERIIEQVAWEVVPYLAEQAIKKEMIASMIEKVMWEVLPPIAEQSVKAAIKKMNDEAEKSSSPS